VCVSVSFPVVARQQLKIPLSLLRNGSVEIPLSLLGNGSILKLEAICSSETSVDSQRNTRRYIPEDGTLQNYRCESLKSYNEDFNFRHQIN
jgi:hypothetical protein